jgi:hypothetical protein
MTYIDHSNQNSQQYDLVVFSRMESGIPPMKGCDEEADGE